MINWTCNLCRHESQNRVDYFHREMGTCENCGSNVRFRAIWYLLTKYVLPININSPKKIVGIGLSDANVYADRLSVFFSYTNTYYHQEPLLDITNSASAAQYSNLDFIICSDVLEHVEMPVNNAFKNLGAMLKHGGYLIFSVPYFTDAISEHTIEHFAPHKKLLVAVEDGREYVISESHIAYTNACWHDGPGSILERRVFSERAVYEHLGRNGLELQEIGDGIADQGIISNMKGSKVMICRKQ